MQANKHHTSQKSPSEGFLTKDLIRIMQLNVEGLSKSKADVLSRILDDEKIDILAIQETHTLDQDQLMKRGSISGYSIAGATYHSKYGTATYVKNDYVRR